MNIIEILLGILFVVFIIILLKAGKSNIVAPMKPRKLTNKDVLETLRLNGNQETSFTDEEFQLVKKRFSSSEGGIIGIALASILCIIPIMWLGWNEFSTLYKIVLITSFVVAFIVFVKDYKSRKTVFETDRQHFTKKQAYLVKAKEQTILSNRGSHLGSDKIYILTVGILDKYGNPVAYKLQVPYTLFERTRSSYRCDAILYKGNFINIVDLAILNNSCIKKTSR